MKKVCLVLVLLSSTLMFGCNGTQGPQIRTSVSEITDLPGGAQSIAVLHTYHDMFGHNQSVFSKYLSLEDGQVCTYDLGYSDAGLAKAGLITASQGVIGQAVRRPSTINAANSGAVVDVKQKQDAQAAADAFVGVP